jgi:lipopolysaccharide transport protein LptA
MPRFDPARQVAVLMLVALLSGPRADGQSLPVPPSKPAPSSPRPAASASPELQARPPGGLSSEGRVKIHADKAIYRKQSKLAQATGHVRLQQDNTTIYADEIFYFEEQKQSIVENGVKIVQENKKQEKGRTTTITAVKMIAFHQEKRFLFEREVRMDREAYPVPVPENVAVSKAEKRRRTEVALKTTRTVITADQIEYFSKTENANLLGNVVVLQKEKKLTGGKAFIKGEQEGDTITLEDNAEVVQLNGNWLIDNKIIRSDPADQEQQRMLREKLTINADKIILNRATDDLEAVGKVRITQKAGGKERVATGDHASYSDKRQMAVLTGNVKIQRENGDWLTAQKAVFYTDKENFEATGTEQQQVISEFTLDESGQEPPQEPINTPLPDFDLNTHLPGARSPGWLGKGGKPEPGRTPLPVQRPMAPSPSPSSLKPGSPALPAATPSGGAAPLRPASPPPVTGGATPVQPRPSASSLKVE